MTLLSVLLQASPGIVDGLSSGIIALAAGFIVFGAGLALGKIGLAAMEAIARQPQAGNDIRMAMILVGAFIEGVALFALVVCLLAI
jgi:F-type H+-transporting ATPase subunit c